MKIKFGMRDRSGDVHKTLNYPGIRIIQIQIKRELHVFGADSILVGIGSAKQPQDVSTRWILIPEYSLSSTHCDLLSGSSAQ